MRGHRDDISWGELTHTTYHPMMSRCPSFVTYGLCIHNAIHTCIRHVSSAVSKYVSCLVAMHFFKPW